GPTTGGTSVTVSGKDFEPGSTRFLIGKAQATRVRCRSGTRCALVTPPGAAGPADVVATLHGFRTESSAVGEATRFTFELPGRKAKQARAPKKKRTPEREDIPDQADQ